MRLTSAGLPEHEQVAATGDPVLAACEREQMWLADARCGIEVEGGEGLARRQAGLVAMTLDAPGRAFCHLDLKQRSEKVGRGPAIAIGGVGQPFPVAVDAWQAQRLEQCGQHGSGLIFGPGHQ